MSWLNGKIRQAIQGGRFETKEELDKFMWTLRDMFPTDYNGVIESMMYAELHDHIKAQKVQQETLDLTTQDIEDFELIEPLNVEEYYKDSKIHLV